MKPLAGLRILEFDGLGPVTFAAMVLADMGADVVRITRGVTAPPPVFDQVGGAVLQRGRPSVPLNLKSSPDRAGVLDLIEHSDALVEGFRPGVMERLGLGPDACAARNPRLVYGRVTGWGQTGPLAGDVGHDINFLGLSGALSLMGEPDRPPRPPLNLAADYAGGAWPLVTGVLAGVIEAKRTGRGGVVDAAMTEGAALTAGLFHALAAAGLWSEDRGANLLDGGAPFYRCYACSDGRFVAVGALEPRFYAALLAGLAVSPDEAPQYDRTRWKRTAARFAQAFATKDRDVWVEHFGGTEACVTPVLSIDEARHHPHNVERGAFRNGLPGPAPRFREAPAGASASADEITLAQAVARWRSSG